jgi:hypothetical protein
VKYEAICRLATKITVNGCLMLDGMTSMVTLNGAMARICDDFMVPEIDFDLLHEAPKGYHLHFDMEANGNLIAVEVDVVMELSDMDSAGMIENRPVPDEDA